MLKQRAAMFGLDARIALAIFGALSVITGAALYSAIKDAKVTSFVTSIDEIGKAHDAYYLDTGLSLGMSATPPFLKVQDLKVSTANGWSGPYISLDNKVEHSLSGYVISEFLDGTWTNVPGNFKCGTGTVGGECYIWNGVFDKTKELAEAIDKKVDGIAGAKTGMCRYYYLTVDSKDLYYIFIKHRIKK